jgi:hypothetical protein
VAILAIHCDVDDVDENVDDEFRWMKTKFKIGKG